MEAVVDTGDVVVDDVDGTSLVRRGRGPGPGPVVLVFRTLTTWDSRGVSGNVGGTTTKSLYRPRSTSSSSFFLSRRRKEWFNSIQTLGIRLTNLLIPIKVRLKRKRQKFSRAGYEREESLSCNERSRTDQLYLSDRESSDSSGFYDLRESVDTKPPSTTLNLYTDPTPITTTTF